MKNLLKKRQSIKYNGGQIVILNTILFLAISLLLIAGIAYPVISHYSEMQSLIQSKQAFLATQSAMDEGLYRLKNGLAISSPTTINLASSSATITISDLPSGAGKRILVNGTANSYQRNAQMDLALGTGISFHYGIQAGNGGFVLDGNSNSGVKGNIFSTGPIIATGQGNTVDGDIISSGPSGLIDDIVVTGTAYAHTINDSIVQKDAHYTNISNTTVGGTSYPNSADQPNAPLPITDAQIAQWEGYAAAGGSSCPGEIPGEIKNASVTLEAQKITCDLNIKNSTVTIAGPIWVTGDITVETGSTIQMSPTLGSNNVAIIADDPSDQDGSGIISLQNGATFMGCSGCTNSFVFMISQNNCAETSCGSTDAISMGQGASALIGYAIHGQITLSQSTNVKEATAYRIKLAESADVTYDTGLPNTLFESGPGGGYDQMGWSEI